MTADYQRLQTTFTLGPGTIPWPGKVWFWARMLAALPVRPGRLGKRMLDAARPSVYLPRMTTTAEVSKVNGQLAELVKQVQAGHEVVLTEDHKPVARLVAASAPEIAAGTSLRIRSLAGHRVLTPVISQSELADEMFGPQ